MNWLDIIIVVVIAISTLIGLKTGIIKAVLSLAGLIIGVALAGRYYIPLSQELTFISSAGVAKIVAFAIILVGIMVIAAVATGMLKRIASALMLGWVDRLGGAILGFVVGATLCGAILAVWLKYLGVAGVIVESSLAPVILRYLPLTLALLPGEFDGVRSYFY